MPDLDARADAARKMADDPRIDVSGIEAVIGTRYTVDTISVPAPPRFRRALSSGSWAPTIWRSSIAGGTGGGSPEMPIAVIDRPPQSFRALAAPAAQALARYRLPENQAGRLADQRAPAWVFLHGHEV